MQKLTNMRNVSGQKVGSQAARNVIASEVKLMRRLNRTADKIGSIVCKRIATPKRANDSKHFIGAEVTPSGKRVAVSKLAVNPIAGMMKTSPKANGHFPSRYVTRRDIELSFHDREEIKSTVRAILSLAMQPDSFYECGGVRHDLEQWQEGEAIPHSLWKVIFRASRDTLGMHKVMSREMLWDFNGAQELEVTLEYAGDVLEETASEQAEESRVLALGAYFRQCIGAAYEADKSRKRNVLKRSMLAVCDVAESLALGKATGHGMASPEATRRVRDRFKAYVAKGAELIRLQPESLALELTESIAARMIE